MSMLSILVKDSTGTRIPVITYKPIDEIIMDLYQQKRWDIIEVTDNSGSFNYQVKQGKIIRKE